MLGFWLVTCVFAGLNQPPEGFTALFNGKNLDGWWGLKTEDPRKWMALPKNKLGEKLQASLEDIRKHWRVENGILINDGKGLYLSTRKNFGDFELLVEYKTVPRADSGIYLRGIPQVQIWDYTDQKKFKLGADKGSGGLWNNTKHLKGKFPLVPADKPFGEWNQFRIIMVGERVTVYFNGKLVVDHCLMDNFFNEKKKGPNLPIPRRGPIQLQTHGGKICWRNIFIREIGPEEANAILASKNSEGFKKIFDGKSFHGWTGATNNYEIVDQAIRCQKGKGGTVYYTRPYTNFAARLEIQIPPGGNNGLAIRYPGQGDPAYKGMCELQVLDNTAPQYAHLDPRQYHGSAYGMVAAHRGYLRKPGTWNFEEVTVKGSSITVELNGTVILDTDLSTVTEFMKNKPHPGKNLTSGFFGFAGHKSPVAFRNICIKELK